jgi:chromate reductase
MKYIISGTNRPNSRTRQVCELIQKHYSDLGETAEILDLRDIGLGQLYEHDYGSKTLPDKARAAIDKIDHAEGLHIVTPEYNGSMPGALKLFIDYWTYPRSFEARPVAFVGLGGRFGGLRPVEHLQGVFGYRNAYIFPVRVFIMDVMNKLKDGQISDQMTAGLLKTQVEGFCRFVRALQSESLDANSVLHPKAPPMP